ncbi:hypothetical protein F2Q70_00038789 [Brassica cretica]|uniref:Uncharacterized protein n=1 Tax=Brassica cretica TaxID=69181 RepID=A0A8S9MBG1_BRACR|nr:hypothetical protein F2Q70_00038789 [Brassica cretica]KAF2617380.1 hypothetical protein F2Q68_00039462 [Brassica cretica]
MSYSESAYERYNKVRALTARSAGEFPSSNNLDCTFGPTRRRASWTACSIQLARSASWTDPTRRTGELVGASGLTPPFGELDDGCFAVRDLLFEALSNLSRRLIV